MEHSFRIGLDKIQVDIHRLGEAIDVYVCRDYNEPYPNDPEHHHFTSVPECVVFLEDELFNAGFHSTLGEQQLFHRALLDACRTFLKGELA